jgi:hypothetical protein
LRSLILPLTDYETDKIQNKYLEYYDPIFAPWVDQEIRLLEIGVYKGGSLLLWKDYFPMGLITGIDIQLPANFTPGVRVQVFEGSQSDVIFLSEVANKVAPDGFDIIIDDASHIGEITRIAFWHLFDNHLKPGGYYVIEDWGTGYWGDWPDGRHLNIRISPISRIWSWMMARNKVARRSPIKIPLKSHQFGMVGLIKQLVDEQGASDVSRENMVGVAKRKSKFQKMIIMPSIVFVEKAMVHSLE